MWSMYLFFVHSNIASKIEMKEKMEEKVTMRLKKSFSNHWLMVRFNLSRDDARNCKETIMFIEEPDKFRASKTCKKC